MEIERTVVFCLMLTIAATGAASGEEFDYEVGAAYANGESDTTTSNVFGVPPTLTNIASDAADTDTFTLKGTWYYTALSDADGPRSRAAFLSRASGISAGYTRREDQSSFEFAGGGVLPPFSTRTETTVSEFAVDLRHVWKDSGWYALAGIANSDVEAEIVFNGSVQSDSFDNTVYSVGVGRYLADATTLDFSIASLDGDSGSAAILALTLRHVGSLGEQWQYGFDAAYGKSDTAGDGDSYTVRGVLYPTPDLQFGAAFSSRDSGRGLDSRRFEVFAGWFVRDNVEISARFGEEDPDTPSGVDVDISEIGLGFLVRF